MTTFLFWNISEKSISTIVADLAHQYKVDVLMLAECRLSPAELLLALNKNVTAYSYVPQIGCWRIELYTRFSETFIPAVYESDRYTIRHLQLPGATSILLAVTHAISKLRYSDIDQASEARLLSTAVKTVEKTVGHTRTVLTGDLNMNPFEDGVVNADGLHGVASQQVAQRMRRVIQKTSYPFFYNPMWSLLGDLSVGPPGTFYHSGSQQKVFFWNMFDQVLIRPELLERFDNSGLKIIDRVGNLSLLSNQGIPDKNLASDHLPLLFKLNL